MAMLRVALATLGTHPRIMSPFSTAYAVWYYWQVFFKF